MDTRVQGIVLEIEEGARQAGAPPLRMCAIVPAGAARSMIVPRDYVGEVTELEGRAIPADLRQLLIATATGADDAVKIIFVAEDLRSIDVINLPASALSRATVRSSLELTAPLPTPDAPAS